MKQKLLLSFTSFALLAVVATASEPPVLLQCEELTESSGIAQSTIDRSVFWTHNDSGDSARLFAFDRSGNWLCEVALRDIKAQDWEDICSFKIDGVSYLAVGDVGDNQAKRAMVNIYVLREPQLPIQPHSTPTKIEIHDFQTITVKYETGAVNCESLAYDPIGRQFVLPSKEFLRCRLFSVSANSLDRNQSLVAKPIASVVLPMCTGADISPDGSRLVLATYGPACMLQRSNNDNQWQVPEDGPQMLEMPIRKQGEAICFCDGFQLALTSEFYPTPLWFTPVPSNPTP